MLSSPTTGQKRDCIYDFENLLIFPLEIMHHSCNKSMLTACIARLTMRRCHNALDLTKDFGEGELMFYSYCFKSLQHGLEKTLSGGDMQCYKMCSRGCCLCLTTSFLFAIVRENRIASMNELNITFYLQLLKALNNFLEPKYYPTIYLDSYTVVQQTKSQFKFV